MSIYQLTQEPIFPPVHLSEPDGLLAVGGDLSVERLMLAYRMGIFPWYNEDNPILWWSPDPRMVLFPAEVKVSKSMKQWIRRAKVRITADHAFRQVLEQCAAANRKGQKGTWILPEMMDAYWALHELGLAHSVEVWSDDKLVGGLYGVQSGRVFSGESMFSLASNTSKLALIAMCRQAIDQGITIIDCQMHTAHLESMGALEIPRKDFLVYLPKLHEQTAKAGTWAQWDIKKPDA